MTRKEFEDRTRRLITAEDYHLVENLYMAAVNMDKDEFCKEMRAMCAYDGANDHIELRQCLKEVGRRVGGMEAELSFLKKTVKKEREELAEFLIGKACAYNEQGCEIGRAKGGCYPKNQNGASSLGGGYTVYQRQSEINIGHGKVHSGNERKPRVLD